MVLVRLLRGYLRPHARSLTLIGVLVVIQTAGNLYLPSLNAAIIDDGVLGGDSGYIWRAGGAMLVVALLLGIVAVLSVRLATQVASAVGAALRDGVHRRVLGWSEQDLSRFGIPSLVIRNVNDVQQVQLFLQAALNLLLLSVVTALGALVMAIRSGPRLSLLVWATVLAMAAIVAVMLLAVVPLFRVVQGKIDRLNRVVREQITGARVIRAFGRQSAEDARYREVNDDMTGTALRANRIFAALLPAVLGLVNLTSVGLIWFGGRLVGAGEMSIGDLTAFQIYILQVLLYVAIGVSVIILLPRAVAGAERITEVVQAGTGIADPPRPVAPEAGTGTVEFRDVSFGYPGSRHPVLAGLSFTVRPGRTTAVVGGTGSGKTTVLQLALRFCAATGGTVAVNGVDVQEQAAERLWARIGPVPQTAFLFAGTVAENLRIARPEASEAELWHALDVAQALDFVSAMPGGLDTPLDSGGRNVSGGQRQRLAIARAVLRRPDLYVFDDCFSALDPATEARLRAALRAETANAAVLIAAQRAGTIMDADEIIVLEHGTVAGRGTHAELIEDCVPYQGIVAAQLGAGATA
ncbi:ABC transporter ATP-binding protein [Catenulispora sp. NF23]|uniref:ABC transporter ATP-binding protein n=1 Tax=Catenulispora pinistramenti TaxID=2705254 RepID=A0ABS5KU41_9ACTN|nr:ABC transporter ATP-binding protein [Catenulispora pinistramenti]MBS2533784.1 ABC transporter ATP-binding protein [Catenulispora pinistramenti]MBS2549576.1 ABC transporter ATP-binding protein [Catenulispora pinistramenti]